MQTTELNKYFISDLKLLSEENAQAVIKILRQRIKDLHNDNYYLTIPLADLSLSLRAHNVLLLHKIEIVKDVLDIGWDKLAMLRGMGPTTLKEIKSLLERIVEKKDRIKGLSGTALNMALLNKK
jgi:hypothetical protein